MDVKNMEGRAMIKLAGDWKKTLVRFKSMQKSFGQGLKNLLKSKGFSE